MNKWLQLIIGLVAVAIAVATGLYARENYLSSLTVVSIPVPLGAIPAHTELTAEMFMDAEIPNALVDFNGGYARSMDDLLGKVATSGLPAGLPVANAVLVPVEDFRPAQPDELVVSIPVSAVNALGGELRTGSLVDVYRIHVAEPETDGVSVRRETGVELVATVRVVDVLDDTGLTILRKVNAVQKTTEVIQTSKAASDGSRKRPEILVFAAPRDVAEDILELVGSVTQGQDVLWIVLSDRDGTP